jgi:type VI protein secretion system component Hcp
MTRKGRMGRIGIIGVLLAAMALPVVAQTGASMTIEGEKQGKFKGETKKKGGEIGVVSLAHEGAGTGKHRNKHEHSPVIVTKEIDASSPQLLKAFETGETLKQVVFLNIGSVGNGTGAGKMTAENIGSVGNGTGAGKMTAENIGSSGTGIGSGKKTTAKIESQGSGAGAGRKIPDTVEMKNVKITNLRKVGRLEEITFAFEKITITWIDGGKTDEDDWSTP